MPSEADTCRTLITPKIQAVGWESEPHSIAEQRSFPDGRIVVHGNRATRRKGKRADYILRYTRDFPIAVVEAKPENDPAAATTPPRTSPMSSPDSSAMNPSAPAEWSRTP
jgi:type I site-specific restriction endonuclease